MTPDELLEVFHRRIRLPDADAIPGWKQEHDGLVHRSYGKKPELFHAGHIRPFRGDRRAERKLDAVKKALNFVGRRCCLGLQQGTEDRMLLDIAEPRVADATGGHRKNGRREQH